LILFDTKKKKKKKKKAKIKKEKTKRKTLRTKNESTIGNGPALFSQQIISLSPSNTQLQFLFSKI